MADTLGKLSKLLSTRLEQIKQDIEGGNLIVEEAVTLLGEAIKNAIDCSFDAVEEVAFNDFNRAVNTANYALLDLVALVETPPDNQRSHCLH